MINYAQAFQPSFNGSYIEPFSLCVFFCRSFISSVFIQTAVTNTMMQNIISSCRFVAHAFRLSHGICVRLSAMAVFPWLTLCILCVQKLCIYTVLSDSHRFRDVFSPTPHPRPAQLSSAQLNSAQLVPMCSFAH